MWRGFWLLDASATWRAPERRVFLEELAKLLSESGWLALTRMMSGENAFAWNYGFEFEGTWFWYQPTFDSDLEKYSPGFCLLAKLIEEAADDPALRTVDLGLGAEEYKERFANQTRETLYVTLRVSAATFPRDPALSRGWNRQDFSSAGSGCAGSSGALAATANESGPRWCCCHASAAGEAIRRVSLVGERGLFLEWHGPVLPDSSELERDAGTLDLNLLASAASQYVDDQATLAYLLRSASRLREWELRKGLDWSTQKGSCCILRGSPLSMDFSF